MRDSCNSHWSVFHSNSAVGLRALCKPAPPVKRLAEVGRGLAPHCRWVTIWVELGENQVARPGAPPTPENVETKH